MIRLVWLLAKPSVCSFISTLSKLLAEPYEIVLVIIVSRRRKQTEIGAVTCPGVTRQHGYAPSVWVPSLNSCWCFTGIILFHMSHYPQYVGEWVCIFFFFFFLGNTVVTLSWPFSWAGAPTPCLLWGMTANFTQLYPFPRDLLDRLRCLAWKGLGFFMFSLFPGAPQLITEWYRVQKANPLASRENNCGVSLREQLRQDLYWSHLLVPFSASYPAFALCPETSPQLTIAQ